MSTDSEPNTSQNSSSSIYLQNYDELQRVFNQFDANKDGTISVTELGDVLKALGSSYAPEELERVMEDIDTDKDGCINLAEFADLCRSSGDAITAASELREAFDLYDRDRNGLISSSELNQVMIRLGMSCSVEDCVRMIQSVDSDGDGFVNFKEFEKMMNNSSCDGNVDGSKP